MLDIRKVLASNVAQVVNSPEFGLSRKVLCERTGVARRTLGHLEAGDVQPQLDTITALAKGLRVEVWQLLAPDLGKKLLSDAAPEVDIDALLKLTTPRSKRALDTIIQAAQEGRLQDEDLELLNAIAARFMTKG